MLKQKEILIQYNMDESPENILWKKPDIKVHTVWFYSNKMYKQIHSNRNSFARAADNKD